MTSSGPRPPASVPLGRADFFALEALEYLRPLRVQVDSGGALAAAEFVRLARALRGAALMAGPAALAHAAQELEAIAKASRDGSLTWTAEISAGVSAGLDRFQQLVGQVRDWGGEETDAAEHLATELRTLAPAAHPAPLRRAPLDSTIPLGVRQFIARETRAVASHLAHAGESDDAAGQVHPALREVLAQMQSLRGLAVLPDLAPLPDLLDAVEFVAADVLHAPPPAPGLSHLLEAGSAALTTAAAAVEERGLGDPHDATAGHFARLLFEQVGRQADVVPIATLLADGPEPSAPTGTPAPARDVTVVDLVALGERFRQLADQLSVARSDVARFVNTTALLVLLRSTPAARAGAASRFARRLQQAIIGPPDDHAVGHVADLLRRAGGRLAADGDPWSGPLATDLAAIADEIAVAVAPRTATPVEPMDAPARVIEAAPEVVPGTEELEIVSIETLLYEQPAPQPVAAPDRTWFETGLSAYAHHQAQPAPAIPPAAEPESALPIVPIETLLEAPLGVARQAVAPRTAPTENAEGVVVPIESLLYRGRPALDRADLVRRELDAALGAREPLDRLEPLLRELLDLVPLALTADA